MERQEVIDLIRQQLDFWEGSNDLTSPAVLIDISEFINPCITDLNTEDSKALCKSLEYLLNVIRKITP